MSKIAFIYLIFAYFYLHYSYIIFQSTFISYFIQSFASQIKSKSSTRIVIFILFGKPQNPLFQFAFFST